MIVMTVVFWWVVAALLVWAFVHGARKLSDRRSPGIVGTPRGPMRSPSNAALRQARKFYSRPERGILPTRSDLEFITNDADAVRIARPVAVGSRVMLVERYVGQMDMRVDVVIPRPQDRVEPENAPYQYIGTPLPVGNFAWRVQFDHTMIWSVGLVPHSESDDDAA